MGVGDGEGDGLGDGEGLALGDGLGLGLRLGLGLGEGAGDGLGNGLGDGVGDGVGDGLGSDSGVGVRMGVGVGVGVVIGAVVGAGAGVGDGSGDGEGEGDGLGRTGMPGIPPTVSAASTQQPSAHDAVLVCDTALHQGRRRCMSSTTHSRDAGGTQHMCAALARCMHGCRLHERRKSCAICVCYLLDTTGTRDTSPGSTVDCWRANAHKLPICSCMKTAGSGAPFCADFDGRGVGLVGFGWGLCVGLGCGLAPLFAGAVGFTCLFAGGVGFTCLFAGGVGFDFGVGFGFDPRGATSAVGLAFCAGLPLVGLGFGVGLALCVGLAATRSAAGLNLCVGLSFASCCVGLLAAFSCLRSGQSFIT